MQKWIDQELSRAHGNRLGLSYGQLAVLLLTYMISQSDLLIGEGFEMTLGSLWQDPDNQTWHRWTERWLAVCSYALRERQIKGFCQRLLKAEQALKKLADRQCFQSIHLVILDEVHQIVNLTQEHQRVLQFLGSLCLKYYLLV